MSDESQTIRNIHWREVFPFTNLFRSFRIAIHPSKLILGLAALILLFAGGRALDGMWPARHRAVTREVSAYSEWLAMGQPGQFADRRAAARQEVESDYAQMLLQYNVVNTSETALAEARYGGSLGDLKRKILDERSKRLEEIRKGYAAAEKLASDQKDVKLREDAMAAARSRRAEYIRQTYASASNAWLGARGIRNEGLFSQFFEYQITQVNAVTRGVGKSNWFGPAGVIHSLNNFVNVGPMWLFTQHTVFFILLTIWFLLVWSVFGGAIARIAAVHVARDEKISMRQALRFSVGKVVSFIFAPIIPLLIVLVVGLVVTAVSLVGNIPGLGPIIVGLLFILALMAGFIITLVLLGLVGGLNLMYPTIAVEGSDSFDAISRSFSYLYARPWRLAFYSIAAIVYGAITYLFVRMFIFLMLVMTHRFVGMGLVSSADNGLSTWNMMWPDPSHTGRLFLTVDYLSLGGGQAIGAFLVSMWVSLVVAMLGAFAISFYFSASTIIYFLMRAEVDATEMEDVYVEQTEDDFAEPAPAAATVTDQPAAERTSPMSDANVLTPPVDAPAANSAVVPPPALTPEQNPGSDNPT